LIGVGVLVNPVQVGGLPTESRSVINQFAVNLPCEKIDKGHEVSEIDL